MDIANKSQVQRHGTQFLARSHFKIGHEPKWLASNNPGAFRSTFKNDYPPQDLRERESLTHLPPAKIMHKDTRLGEYHTSVTRDHYGPKELIKTGYRNLPYALSTTNFKMDADKKIDSFKTTHCDHYYEKSLKDAKNSSAREDWTKSHIPQGDPEKIGWSESAYKSNYVPFGTRLEPIKHSSAFDGPPTIKGDIRIHNGSLYGTTTKELYGNKYNKQIKVDDSVRYPATHIPQGDREKFGYSLSTQQEDFGPPKGRNELLDDRSKVLEKLQSTSFTMGDKRLDSFQTTVQDSYQNVSTGGVVKSIKIPLGKSSFPEGDKDYLNNVERFSNTTNSRQFKPPPSDFRNPKIDGSKLRTESSVHFGNDDVLNSYTTTMKDNFKELSSRPEKALGNVYQSSIPTDYYKNHVGQATYRMDYKASTESSKSVLNPIAIMKLKSSSINITEPSFQEFDTTHRVTYTPKESRMQRETETGKLQKSSVPIGTLQRQ